MLSGIVELVNSKIFKLHVPSKTEAREKRKCAKAQGGSIITNDVSWSTGT